MENKQAPKFTILNQRGEKVSLKQELEENMVLLYFYPKDMTSGCTLEGIGFGKNGKVIKHWSKVKPATHPDEVLEFISTL